ncbi:MAG: hypothetical protein JXR46_07875 [Calditrichaceae bacterium]|nr:hypothetical protein [Calditrichaceae bacterium]MBN2708946.1 hypothetical protein [Calditrichaceae bacterium]RQV97531.1 MAG: hypothetical protein EH224_00485 [Calditrichota bacterium]
MADTIKDKVRDVLNRLPDNSTLDDIIHALYVQAKFEHGDREIEAGKGIPHEEVKKRLFDKWVK